MGRARLPEYVFLEVVTVRAARRDREAAVQAGDVLLGNREIGFIPCPEFFMPAFDIFRRHSGLSFADAAIVAIAHECRASILTFDANFESVDGFEVVP